MPSLRVTALNIYQVRLLSVSSQNKQFIPHDLERITLKRITSTSSLLTGLLLAGTLSVLGGQSAIAGAAITPSCNAITKTLIAGDGYTGAITPKVTPYNYTKTSANPANALGTTIDFGAKALVVGCISPSDIQKLSVMAQGSSKPTMSAVQYMAYIVKQSAGAMNKTPVGGVSDYLDFGNGKEDGLGSTSKAGGVRLDAWVAGKFIFLTFSAPVSVTATKPLLSFVKSTQKMF
jgi:hypothetical protein